MRAILEASFRDAVAACDPRAQVRASCASDPPGRRVVVLAIGKAAPAMAAGACDALGDAPYQTPIEMPGIIPDEFPRT